MSDTRMPAAAGDRMSPHHMTSVEMGDWSSYAHCSCGWASGELPHAYSSVRWLMADLDPANIAAKAHRRKMSTFAVRMARKAYHRLYRLLDSWGQGYQLRRTFECKGGIHDACQGCSCYCHTTRLY